MRSFWKSPLLLLGIASTLLLSACAGTPDAMPPTKVDIFVLDLSGSNDKQVQLKRLDEDLNKSLTDSALGVPKMISTEPVRGPSTTIFTFIEDVALKAESFKLQDGSQTVQLWDAEFASDRERNARSWSDMSNVYNSYLKRTLTNENSFTVTKCTRELSTDLSSKFVAESKRLRVVRPLCEKVRTLVNGYQEMRQYVESTNAPATDIYGMLAKIDRLVSQIKDESPDAMITVNIGSDMQHETSDSRDTPSKLRAINYERTRACELGSSDRKREGLTFDRNALVKVSGIGNANINAQYGNALVRYWECFFDTSAEIR